MSAADVEESFRPSAVFGEARNTGSPPSLPLDPVRVGVGGAKAAMAPVPLELPGPGANAGREEKTPKPLLAVEPMGVSDRSGEVKNAKAPLRLEPSGDGCSGKAQNAKLPLLPLEGDSADEKAGKARARGCVAGGLGPRAAHGGSAMGFAGLCGRWREANAEVACGSWLHPAQMAAGANGGAPSGGGGLAAPDLRGRWRWRPRQR